MNARYYHFGRMKMKKLAFFIVVACVVAISYYTLYPPFYATDDNIPYPSCTEMTTSDDTSGKINSGDIMIGIRLTNRKGYTKFTSAVIRKYQEIADDDVHVFSKASYDYEQGSLLAWYGNRITVHKFTSGSIAVKTLLEGFIQSKYKVLFLIDSEMVFLLSWRKFITQNMITKTIPFLSLYHSATLHSYKSHCENMHADLCKGKISGHLGVAMNKDFAMTLLKKYRKSDDFQFDWNHILSAENVQGRYPTRSLIMRIGQTGQDRNFCGKNEAPYGFKLCELPCWIRNGIEFFFDLCTDPQETYSPDSSLLKAHRTKRLWVRPVIAYSFYGNKVRYVDGALENAKRIFTIYPGYKIWAYVDNTVAPEVIQSLCSDNVKLVNMTGSQIKNQMSWRFLIASEPVPWFTILDIDYRMISRGREATDEWLRSDRKFHVMRDHPEHSVHAMNGQMWGGYGYSIPNMKQLIAEYGGGNWFMMDIHFLTSKIWPIVKKSVWVHDAYPLHKFGEDRPFPSERVGQEFVGNVDFG